MENDRAAPAHLVELLEWHRDEVSAQAMFEELAQAAADADCARKWRTLARLEGHVAAQLAAALAARGVTVPSPAADQARRTQAGNPYLELSWRAAMEAMRPWLARYVDEFKAAESRMPAELLPLARFVTAHEQALLDFVTRELGRDGRDSLTAVHGVLDISP
ncbi:MAG: hypothetical protein JSR15_11625 [Proteobacteria bacterium]|nr:hypothetical protein [Pseudomonadota bacterium]